MKIALLLLVALILIPAISPESFAASETCGSLGSAGSDAVSYCERDNASSDVLLVFFHGVGTTERRIFGADSYDPLSTVEPARFPSVLSLSFGRFRFLSGNDNIAAAASLIEGKIAEIQARHPGTRVVLLGDSMGGFDGLQIFLRRPLPYDKVALLCPAVTATSPFADNQTWDSDPDYASSSTGYRFVYRRALWANFGNAGTWNESEPLGYLKTRFTSSEPRAKFFIATVERDDYGFIRAHGVLQELFEARGYRVEHLTTLGASHCHVTPEEVANFVLDP